MVVTRDPRDSQSGGPRSTLRRPPHPLAVPSRGLHLPPVPALRVRGPLGGAVAATAASACCSLPDAVTVAAQWRGQDARGRSREREADSGREGEREEAVAPPQWPAESRCARSDGSTAAGDGGGTKRRGAAGTRAVPVRPALMAWAHLAASGTPSLQVTPCCRPQAAHASGAPAAPLAAASCRHWHCAAPAAPGRSPDPVTAAVAATRTGLPLPSRSQHWSPTALLPHLLRHQFHSGESGRQGKGPSCLSAPKPLCPSVGAMGDSTTSEWGHH